MQAVWRFTRKMESGREVLAYGGDAFSTHAPNGDGVNTCFVLTHHVITDLQISGMGKGVLDLTLGNVRARNKWMRSPFPLRTALSS